MPIQTLEEIEVFALAEEIADRWWKIVSEWRPFAQDTIGRQIVRAADSVGANIAESYGRYHLAKRSITYITRVGRCMKPSTLPDALTGGILSVRRLSIR